MGQQPLAGFFFQERWWQRDVQRRVGHRGPGCTSRLAAPSPLTPSQLPPPPPYPQLQPAFGPQPRVGRTPPPYLPDQLPGFQAGFRTGYHVGWAQGYQAGQQEEPELGKGKTNTPELQVLTGGKEMTMAAAMLATSRSIINI